MNWFWRTGLALTGTLTLCTGGLTAGKTDGSWLDHAIRWAEKTGQITVIHRRFCRHIELRCSRFGVDVKFVKISDRDGEHDLGVVQKYPKVAMFFFMDKAFNTLFAMHGDGAVYRVIKIDVAGQQHEDLPADAYRDLFDRESEFWRRQVPVN